jgi:hypothetical protein
VKVYLNYNIPSLQIALRHSLLKCKNNNNGNKTKKQKCKKIDLMPYESILQNLNKIDPKSNESIFLPSPNYV